MMSVLVKNELRIDDLQVLRIINPCWRTDGYLHFQRLRRVSMGSKNNDHS